ncbi:MAG: hypothetical protein IKF82_05815 [Bacilli bacterium]|nr:hypothetical protein [Bacilli bacterium]
MKIYNQRQRRNYIIIALCIVLLLMGVGYAAFSSLLTINGTASVSNSWCVGFDITKTNTMNITKGLSTGTTPTGTMSYTGSTCEVNYKPNAQLASAFYQPGDEIEYTLTIKNKSSVTAAIKSIIINGNESVTSDWKHTDGNISYEVKMPEDTTLDPNEETTMTVITKFQNETPIEGSYSMETRTLSIAINSEQDNGEGGMEIIPSTFTGPIYRWSTTRLANKDSSSASTYPYTIANLTEGTDYVKNASLLNKTYYLKHDIVDDEITNTYVCFVYNNAEHCMKGADGGASFAANTQIIQDYQSFYNLGAYSNGMGCGFDSSSSYCYGGGFYYVYAISDGKVNVYGSSSESCFVRYYDGSSNCIE